MISINNWLMVGMLSISLVLIDCKESTTESNGDDGSTLTEINDVLPNPFKGFAPWIGSNNPVYETKLQ